jgi:hypothetical protein
MTATTPTRRFELVDYKAPVQKFADAGAVRAQGDSKPMKKCDCGALVVWVKSARTGRSYLAHCFRYSGLMSDRYYYVKASVHTHDVHAERLAARAARNIPSPCA